MSLNLESYHKVKTHFFAEFQNLCIKPNLDFIPRIGIIDDSFTVKGVKTALDF